MCFLVKLDDDLQDFLAVGFAFPGAKVPDGSQLLRRARRDLCQPPQHIFGENDIRLYSPAACALLAPGVQGLKARQQGLVGTTRTRGRLWCFNVGVMVSSSNWRK